MGEAWSRFLGIARITRARAGERHADDDVAALKARVRELEEDVRDRDVILAEFEDDGRLECGDALAPRTPEADVTFSLCFPVLSENPARVGLTQLSVPDQRGIDADVDHSRCIDAPRSALELAVGGSSQIKPVGRWRP